MLIGNNNPENINKIFLELKDQGKVKEKDRKKFNKYIRDRQKQWTKLDSDGITTEEATPAEVESHL